MEWYDKKSFGIEAEDVKKKLRDHIFRFHDGEDGAEMYKDFEVKEFPYCILVETSGLVAWRGHPMDRDICEDLNDLMRDRILLETEDWHDDPDAGVRDPDEVELEKDLDVAQKKPKPLVKVLQIAKEKMQFFFDIMQKKVILDASEGEAGKHNMYLELVKRAEKLHRAFLIFNSRVQCELCDDMKHKNKITLHVVAQGKPYDNKDFRDFKDYVEQVIRAIKGSWRQKVTGDALVEEYLLGVADAGIQDYEKSVDKKLTKPQIKALRSDFIDFIKAEWKDGRKLPADPESEDDKNLRAKAKEKIAELAEKRKKEWEQKDAQEKKVPLEDSDDESENKEYALFERSKLGWYFRKLYIEYKTPEQYAEEAAKKEKEQEEEVKTQAPQKPEEDGPK